MLLFVVATAWATIPDDAALNQRLERGKISFQSQCAQCHGANLEGAWGPPLKGAAFWTNWEQKPARGLYDRVLTTMPPNGPGTLGAQEVLDLMVYILQQNDVHLSSAGEADSLDGQILAK